MIKRRHTTTGKVAKKPSKGRRLPSQAKYIIEDVRKFFERENSKSSKDIAVIRKTAKATGLSVSTIKRIHSEFLMQDHHFLTPVKRYNVSRIRINVDSFDKLVFRRIINDYYEKKEYPSLDKILVKAKQQLGFPKGKFCLWRILRDMGYSYKKRDDKQFLYEQRNILEQRHISAANNKIAERQYQPSLDETWVNPHHSNDYIWIDSDGKGGWKVPSGKGVRLIVLHAGGENGWVDGVDLVFKSKTNSADYHDEN